MEKLKKRFHAKYIKGDPNDCWEWMAGKSPCGYGRMSVNGKNTGAHRVAYMLHTSKKIPIGLFVCHKCDNPPCVNPEHLFLGTRSDNMKDCTTKKRSALQQRPWLTQGEKHPLAKLTVRICKEIIKKRILQKKTLTTIGNDYGISASHVSQIVKGYLWRHDKSLNKLRDKYNGYLK